MYTLRFLGIYRFVILGNLSELSAFFFLAMVISRNQKPNGELEVIYTPPHGKNLLQELLIDMLDYIYDDDSYTIHPLIKIALAHYQFESIHPFRDGNGRTGRILNVLFLCQKDNKFTYIASGSLLGVTLADTPSIPMGSIRKVRMYPLDFEEFLYANGMNEIVVNAMRKKFEKLEPLDEPMHNKIMDLFRKYLLVGGLPDAVNVYLEQKNIQSVREVQREIHSYYAADASKYDEEKKLMIRRVYDLIPSNMENKKKRVIAQKIENKRGKTFSDYVDEFEYLISAGIALKVQSISNPSFPLIESAGKNLLKLYLSDVGILTGILYGNNIRAVLGDERSINLGSVYETVVASELIAHGFSLFYYDNRSKGEVDYLIDDYASLSTVPIEVKSGKDYTVHSALNAFTQNEDYHIQKAFVVSNEREIMTKGKVTYLPIYYIMFFSPDAGQNMDLQF